MFVSAWSFRTAPEVARRFADAYGPEGAWVRLLRDMPGYIGTETLRDVEDPMRFLVLDHWRDEADFRRFRSEHAKVYEELDRACLEVTQKEEKLGHFVTWDGTVDAPGARAPASGPL